MAKKSTTSKPAGAGSKKAPVTTARKPAAGKKTGATAKTAKKRMPSQEEISQKAHAIFLERIASGKPGDPDSDWLQALDILKS